LLLASTLSWLADQKMMGAQLEMEKALKFGSDAYFKELT
jgi:hypothetical protein